MDKRYSMQSEITDILRRNKRLRQATPKEDQRTETSMNKNHVIVAQLLRRAAKLAQSTYWHLPFAQ